VLKKKTVRSEMRHTVKTETYQQKHQDIDMMRPLSLHYLWRVLVWRDKCVWMCVCVWQLNHQLY